MSKTTDRVIDLHNTSGITSLKFETGLRTFMRRHKNSRDWRVVLRIDWETGSADVRRVHTTEGTSFRTYRRFQSEFTLSPKLTNKNVRELILDIEEEVKLVRLNWTVEADMNSNLTGQFNSEAWDSWGTIRNLVTDANDWVESGMDSQEWNAGRA